MQRRAPAARAHQHVRSGPSWSRCEGRLASWYDLGSARGSGCMCPGRTFGEAHVLPSRAATHSDQKAYPVGLLARCHSERRSPPNAGAVPAGIFRSLRTDALRRLLPLLRVGRGADAGGLGASCCRGFNRRGKAADHMGREGCGVRFSNAGNHHRPAGQVARVAGHIRHGIRLAFLGDGHV